MSPRILVVEDHAASRELLRDWLQAEGYQVSVAENLGDAFEALACALPHAVLLDIQLGSEDGLRLASALRRQPRFRHIPVIAVTAHAMPSHRERIFQAGCVGWVPKPLDFDVLRAELKRWLGLPRDAPAGPP